MRKTLSFILIMISLFCLCGCQNTKTNDNDINSSSLESTVDDNIIVDNSVDETFTLSEKLIGEIDGAYSEEQKLPENSTTVNMVELADKYTEKWKQVAEEYYGKLMEYNGIIEPSEDYYSADDFHTFISDMKTNWENYNQVQSENYYKTLQTIYGAGTIIGPIFADYKYEMQKDWALQLVGIYQQLNIID